MRDALKNRVVLAGRPQIVEVPGERNMPGAKMIVTGRIRPNPAQPRRQFDRAGLEELAASIRERGIMQPLVVRPSGDGYTITMGERRFRAALLAGLDEVPVIVRDVSDEQAFLDALIENLQRANLTDEEEAEAYRGLLAQGHGVREIAAKLGIAPSKVSRLTRVFEDPSLAAAIAAGKITKSQAQEMLAAPLEARPRIIALIAERRESSRPVGLGELRAAVTDSRPSVALRNSSRTAHPAESGVALRNTSLPDGVISVDHQRTTSGADIPATPADAVMYSLGSARQHAHLLRKLFEQQLPLLYASRHDPEVAGDLAKIHERLSSILRNPAC
jgi:ParB family chromosome partitioning protein